MPAPRSSSARSGSSGGRKSAGSSSGSSKRASGGTRSGGGARSSASTRSGSASRSKSRSASPKTKRSSQAQSAGGGQGSRASALDQLVNLVIRPLGLVVLTRERIQEVLDEAAERGRVTRADANELVLELVKRGRQQTDEVLKDMERRVGAGRDQLESAGRRVRGTDSVDRIVRGADRARRTVGVGPSFPILGYDDLTAGQVEQRLSGLKPAELRTVRDYERRHANRKSVLDAVERGLP